MFAVNYKKNNSVIVVVGASKTQVKQKLMKMGLKWNKFPIEEYTEPLCPVCQQKLILDKHDILMPESVGCFFCEHGITL